MHKTVDALQRSSRSRSGSASTTNSRGSKRKRQASAPDTESGWCSASSVDEALEEANWYNTTSGDQDSSAQEENTPKRRARESPMQGRGNSHYYGRWMSLRARSQPARPVHATPLRTWRQRARIEALEASPDASLDSMDDEIRPNEPRKPLGRAAPTLGAPGGFAPAASPRPKETTFTRSPRSHRLRRYESPGKGLSQVTPRPPRPVRRRQRYTGLERHFRGVGLAPSPQKPTEESGMSDADVWDDASDSSSLSDVESVSTSLSEESDEEPSALGTALPGQPRRMRTRSLSKSDMDLAESTEPPRPEPQAGNEIFTQHALLRRRRPSLLALCQARGIDVPSEATKATCVDSLLASQVSTQVAVTDAVRTDMPPPPKAIPEPQPAPEPPAGDEELNGLDLERLELLDREIPPEKLEKLEKIGSGAFKDVYVGKYHISRTRTSKVAISDLRNQLTDMDIKELTFLRDLRHENIVRFIGVSIPADLRPVPCMIVSELCSNGDMFDYIRNTPPPPDADLFQMLLEIARGLEYLHTRTPMIIHRDCKSTNVLITKDRVAKISDFGFARVKRSTRAMVRSIVGTVNWQAVELWVPKPNYNEKVDVWSAAMTFWEALQWHQPEKRYPFQGMNEHQIYFNVGQKGQRYVSRLTQTIYWHDAPPLWRRNCGFARPHVGAASSRSTDYDPGLRGARAMHRGETRNTRCPLACILVLRWLVIGLWRPCVLASTYHLGFKRVGSSFPSIPLP